METVDQVLIKAKTLLEITRETITLRSPILQEQIAILNLQVPNDSLKISKAKIVRMTRRKKTFPKSQWEIFNIPFSIKEKKKI